MKRKLALLLSCILLSQSVAAFAATEAAKDGQTEPVVEQAEAVTALKPDGISVETANVINTDFSNNIPDSLADLKGIVDGEPAFFLKSNSKITESNTYGKFSKNSYIEADFKLVSSNASSSGGASITMLDRGSGASRTVRFVYFSRVPLNTDTMMCSGGPILSDRIGIVDAGSFSLAKWHCIKYGKQLGLQESEKVTPWVKFQIISYNDTYYFSIYNSDGKLLDSISATAEEVFGDETELITGYYESNGGRFRISSNSSEIAFDNIRAGNIEVVDDVKFNLETKSAEKGKPVNFAFKDAAGKHLSLEGVQYLFDTEKAALSEDGKSITFNETGDYEVVALVKDLGTGNYNEYKSTIKIVDKIDYKSLKIAPDSQSVYKNAPLGITVHGVDAVGDEFILSPEEYQIALPTPDGDAAGTVDFESAGAQKIKVTKDGLSGETEVYVSQNKALTPKLGTTVIEQTKTTSYSFDALTDSGMRTLGYGEYTLTSDREGLAISGDGTITALKVGKYNLTFSSDKMSETVPLEVIERKQGLIIDEDFNGPGDEDYFNYPLDKVVDDNGNKVLHLANEESQFFGSESWQAYTIETKVKIVNPVIDERAKFATFEVTPLKKYNTDRSMIGGEGGTQCIYRLNHGIDSGSHMRISASHGKNINLEDGQWHDVKVDVYNNQIAFTIDGETMYYNQSRTTTGYFTFTANNCEVYIDDVKVTRNPYSHGKPRKYIEAVNPVVEMNPYDPKEFRALNAYRMYYDDGTFNYLVNASNSYLLHGDNSQTFWCEVIDGEEYAYIIPGTCTLNFEYDTPAGTEATIRAHYDGMSCDFKVRATANEMSYKDWVKSTVDLRGEDHTFRLVKGWGNGLDDSSSARGTIPQRLATMTAYPQIRDYSDVVRWYSKATEYEEVYIGRGTDAGDFILITGMNTYNTLKGIAKCSDEAWDSWKEFILGYRWQYPHQAISENHRGIFYTVAVMAGQAFPDDIFLDGKTGKETYEEHLGYLTDWVNYRLERGQGETESTEYYHINLFNAELASAGIEDEKVKKMLYDYMTFLYADMLPESLGNQLSGAQMRYYHEGRTGSMKNMTSLKIYFNLGNYMINETHKTQVQEIPYAQQAYYPPDVLFDVALDEDRTEEVYERNFEYILVDDRSHDNSTVKYAYRTPEFSIGSRLYNENLFENPDYSWGIPPTASYNIVYTLGGVYPNTRVYLNHQGINWTVNLGKGNYSILTENHPGSYKFNSDGMDFCDCGKYMQYKGASIGMHSINQNHNRGTLDSQKQPEYTHFYVPSKYLEGVEDVNGWVFVKHYGVFVAIKPMKDGLTTGTLYTWGNPNSTYNGMPMSECEVRTDSTKTAFVCEVTSEKDFGGTYEEFKEKVLANEKNITYKVGDDEHYLEYIALDGTKLKVDYLNNTRYKNDEMIDFTTFKLRDSKYVQSEWMSGVINITSDENSYQITKARYNLDTATVIELSRTIDKLTDGLRYENKFGRGAEYMAANSDEFRACVNIFTNYNKTYMYDVMVNKLKNLKVLVDVAYNKANAAQKSAISDIITTLDTNLTNYNKE